jgi:hypothetical protein
MRTGWKEIARAASILLVVALADRDVADSTVVEFRGSNGMVAIKHEGRTKRDESVQGHQGADRAGGLDQASEHSGSDAIVHSSLDSSHGSAATQADAPPTQGVDSNHPGEDRNRPSEQPEEIWSWGMHREAVVSGHKQHESTPNLLDELKIGTVVIEAPAPQERRAGESLSPEVPRDYSKSKLSDAGTEVRSAPTRPKEDEEELEPTQEVVLSTSTYAPESEAAEGLARGGFSVLSVIFFTYLLLALAALAAFTAYVTRVRTATSSEPTEKDLWSYILRHGFLSSGPSSKPGISPQQQL